MDKFHLMNVRVLPISVIAEKWAEETSDVGRDVIEQELRISILNKRRYDRGLVGLIPHIPAEKVWPPASTRIDQDHIRWFCNKQKNWPLPEFWFGKQIKPRKKPGRPPLNKSAIVQEYELRKANGEAKKEKTAEAKHLAAWFSRTHPSESAPETGTIENWLSEVDPRSPKLPQN